MPATIRCAPRKHLPAVSRRSWPGLMGGFAAVLNRFCGRPAHRRRHIGRGGTAGGALVRTACVRFSNSSPARMSSADSIRTTSFRRAISSSRWSRSKAILVRRALTWPRRSPMSFAFGPAGSASSASTPTRARSLPPTPEDGSRWRLRKRARALRSTFSRSRGTLERGRSRCLPRYVRRSNLAPRLHPGAAGQGRRRGLLRDDLGSAAGQRSTEPQLDIYEVITPGDLLACRFTMSGAHLGRFMGAAATGRAYLLPGITMIRYDPGEAVERWSSADTLGRLVQPGAVPAPGAPSADAASVALCARARSNAN